MSDWLERLIQGEEFLGKVAQLMSYWYRTHLSIPWFLSYFALLFLAWGHITFRAVDLTPYAIIIGAALFVLTAFSHAREPITTKSPECPVCDGFAEITVDSVLRMCPLCNPSGYGGGRIPKRSLRLFMEARIDRRVYKK